MDEALAETREGLDAEDSSLSSKEDIENFQSQEGSFKKSIKMEADEKEGQMSDEDSFSLNGEKDSASSHLKVVEPVFVTVKEEPNDEVTPHEEYKEAEEIVCSVDVPIEYNTNIRTGDEVCDTKCVEPLFVAVKEEPQEEYSTNEESEEETEESSNYTQETSDGQSAVGSPTKTRASCADSQTAGPSSVKKKRIRKTPLPRRHSCNECGKAFRTPSKLQTHIRIHTNEKPFKCHICNKGFAQKDHLPRHLLVHSGEKPHLCNQCGAPFARKDRLDEHMKTHFGRTLFDCKYCPKRFTELSSLNRHTLTHTKEKLCACPFCEKTFIRTDAMKSHMRTHTKEKPFDCSICKKAFAKKTDLNRHILTHTGERPYVCNECGKQFALKGTLKKHELIHSGEKPYSCESCGKLYRQKRDLDTHIVNKHS